MNDNFAEKEALTPQCIVGQNLVFSVPIYQRLFVWEQEQIEKLLKDLLEAREADKQSPYYIGIITVKESKDGVWEVVDGQQRLTFLTLFAAMCSQKREKSGETGEPEGWKNFLFLDEQTPRIKYTGRDDDKEEISKIAKGETKQIQNSHFKCFVECFEHMLSTNNVDLHDFSEYVFKKTFFFVSRLPDHYKPRQLNLFFEKMNSAGRQLEPVDLVKIRFANYASQWNACMNFDKPYEEGKAQPNENKPKSSLAAILEDESNTEIRPEPELENHSQAQNRLILKPEIFLLHVLRLATENDKISLNADNLLQTFKGEKVKEKTFIDEMIAYRKWLDGNIIYLRSEEKNGNPYAFRNSEDAGEDSGHTITLRQFQSMLYVSSSDSQEWVLEAYNACKDDKNGLTLDLLQKQDQDKKRHTLPELKDLSYRTIDRYWFWKLDFLLWDRIVNKKELIDTPLRSGMRGLPDRIVNKKEVIDIEQKIRADSKYFNLVKGYIFRRNRSIEHLRPQADPFPNSDIENSFGNLAMIAPGTNSSLGKSQIHAKFGRIQDILASGGHLESIKLLYMFLSVESETLWDKDRVETHGGAMRDILNAGYGQSDSCETSS